MSIEEEVIALRQRVKLLEMYRHNGAIKGTDELRTMAQELIDVKLMEHREKKPGNELQSTVSFRLSECEEGLSNLHTAIRQLGNGVLENDQLDRTGLVPRVEALENILKTIPEADLLPHTVREVNGIINQVRVCGARLDSIKEALGEIGATVEGISSYTGYDEFTKNMERIDVDIDDGVALTSMAHPEFNGVCNEFEEQEKSSRLRNHLDHATEKMEDRYGPSMATLADQPRDPNGPPWPSGDGARTGNFVEGQERVRTTERGVEVLRGHNGCTVIILRD